MPMTLTSTSTRPAFANSSVKVLDIELARLGKNDEPQDYLQFLETGAELGARHVLCQAPDSDRVRVGEKLSELCALAKPLGLTVDLEFPSWTETGKLADAVEIVDKVNQDNVGVLVDTLHFARSDSGLDELKRVPSERLHFIQLCDASKNVPATIEGLIHTARHDRELPGKGGIELIKILQKRTCLGF